MRAELTKRLDVKRSDVRARGDMIGIPLPNILDRWALHTGRCGGATAEKSRAVPERPRSILIIVALRSTGQGFPWLFLPMLDNF